ncbi:ester cyclase [Pontibacter oryzae]|uniref:Ester cyclase n=1 Tax=Pontibacter oryzae TaxID=2304593 RepID=A0A399RQI1_9BACT|nr:ester cyclase [Pontibacter oryzae]RIJ34070.1 ester cyclase [Pontibacter oryzae]
MSKQTNIETQKKFGEAINTGQLQKFHELMTADVLDHDPAPDQGPGPEGFIQFFSTFRAAFPDLKVNVEHMVADDDSVAIAYTVTGSHQGDFMGIAPTNKSIKARGVQIARFEGGKIAERWGSSDELGTLKQIGAQISA